MPRVVTLLRSLFSSLLISLALIVGFTGAARAQSALDGFDPNANGPIYDIVVQPDGKILIAGNFTSLSPNGGAAVTRNRIARLNVDGTLDTAFDPNADNAVDTIALQADGKVIAGGNFSNIGGAARSRIARLDATTGAADSWNPSATGVGVYTLAIDSSGKVLVGGDFSSIGGQTRARIARLDPTTGNADFWNPDAGGGSAVYTIAVQADGKVLAGGSFTTIGGQSRNRIARLDAATGLADSWNPNANDNVLSMVVQPDSKIVVGGNFNGTSSIGGQTRNRIARLDPTTGLADSFNPNANNVVRALALQADGRVLVGGDFNGASSIGGQTRNYIARVNTDGTVDPTFDPNANANLEVIAVQSDGKILAGGNFTTTAGTTRNRIARLETDGRLDQTLVANVSTSGNYVLAAAVQPDGKILIGGIFTTVAGVTRNNIARLNTDGTLDTTFNPSATGAGSNIYLIVVRPDGKILVGGGFTSIGGQSRNNIALLDSTGAADLSFNPNANGNVYSMALQPDGKVLVGGAFTSIGGQSRNRIARLNTDGSVDLTFDPNASGDVYSIAVQADGKVLVGGAFNGANSIGGATRNHIARLDATTGAADSFDPNANAAVNTIVLQPDGKILVGGNFNGAGSIGGLTRNRIARLDPSTGAVEVGFDPNANGDVYTFALQSDGKILVGGIFSGPGSIGGQTRNRIARLTSTGGVDSFDPDANQAVYVVVLQSDGKILVGGLFNGASAIGGQSRDRFARLTNDTSASQNLAAMGTNVFWARGGSSPQFSSVTFESSTDNVNYTPLGNGTSVTTGGTGATVGWIWPGTLTLPVNQNIYIRARGHYSSGTQNASAGMAESVRLAFLAPRPGTAVNAITSYDAAIIACNLVGGGCPLQAAAADTSGNCMLSSLDAGLIGNYVVNTGTTLTTGTVISPPGPCANFTPITTNVLKGEMTGTLPAGGNGNVAVSLPSASAPPGIIDVPIIVGSLDGRDVRSYDLQVTFDPSVITPDSFGFTQTGTLSSAMSVRSNTANPGHLIISSFISFPSGTLSGSGTLLNLRFNVVGSPGQSTTLTFTDYTDPDGRIHQGFLFNEGLPTTSITNGSLTVIAPSPTPTATATETLTPTPTPVALNAITSYDAALIAKHASGVSTLTGNQLAAADVSANCAISSVDALFVVEYVTDLGAGDTTGTIITPPGPCVNFPITGSVLKGDVTGTSSRADILGTLVNVSLPVLSATPGPVVIPITVGSFFAQSYDLQITFDPSIITPASPAFDASGTVSSSAFISANANNPGHLIVSAFSSSAFPGAGSGGTLLNLRFNVVGSPGQSTGLTFENYISAGLGSHVHQDFLFDEGYPFLAVTTNGSVTIPGAPASVSGTITYGNAIGNPVPPRFVKNVSLSSTAGSPAVGPVLTGTPGTYLLSGFGSGSYTIKPTKPGGSNGAITSNDAARVAQGVVASPGFVSQNQRFAADTSGNGNVTSNDAALIARFAAGLTGAGNAGQWKFFVTGAPSPLPTAPQTYNDSRSYASVTGNLTGEDYVAILVGEVSGNWNPATHPRPVGSRQLAEGSEETVTGGQWSVVGDDSNSRQLAVAVGSQTAAGNEIVVPVKVDGAMGKEIISYDFNLRYDPSVIQPMANPVDVTGTVSRGLFVVANPYEPGLLRVVVYGAYPIDEDGVLLNLRFTAVGGVGSISYLKFENLIFNDGEPQATVTNGQIEISASASQQSE